MFKWMKTRLTSLLRRERLEQELDSELSFHIDMLTEQNIRAGMAPDEARAQAVQRFGSVEGVKDDVRDTWLSRVFETLGQDIRYGLRNLRRNPGFALVVDRDDGARHRRQHRDLQRRQRRAAAAAAVRRTATGSSSLRQQRPLAGDDDIGFSPKEIADYATQRPRLDGRRRVPQHVVHPARPLRARAGVDRRRLRELLRRARRAADARPRVHARGRAGGAPAVLVLSHKYWQRSFGGDPSIVGRVFQMNDRPHEVVGVLPPVPQYPGEVDVYMPTSACPFRSSKRMVENPQLRMMSAFGKIRKGVTLEKARADLAVVAARLQKDYPDVYPVGSGLSDRRHPAAGGADAFVQDDAAGAARHGRRSSC